MYQRSEFSADRSLAIGLGLILVAILGVSLTAGYAEPARPLATETSPASDAPFSAAQPLHDAQETRVPDPDATNTRTARTDPATPERRSVAQAERERISPRVGRIFSDVIALLNADRFDEAWPELEQLLTGETMAQLSPYELSRLYQLSSSLHMNDESYEAASADLLAAIESGGLNEQELEQMEYQRAQLFVQMEDYDDAAEALERWIARPGAAENKAAYYLLGASYYYQEKYDDARDAMEALFSLPGEKQEGWYSMMASLYVQAEDYQKAQPVLERMVELYGREAYVEQLRGINQKLSPR